MTDIRFAYPYAILLLFFSQWKWIRWLRCRFDTLPMSLCRCEAIVIEITTNREIDAFVSLSCLDMIFVRFITLIESNHDVCIPLWLSVWVRVNDFYQLPFSIQSSFMASFHFGFIHVHLCVYHLPLYVARSRHHLPCLMFTIAWIVIVESSQNEKEIKLHEKETRRKRKQRKYRMSKSKWWFCSMFGECDNDGIGINVHHTYVAWILNAQYTWQFHIKHTNLVDMNTLKSYILWLNAFCDRAIFSDSNFCQSNPSIRRRGFRCRWLRRLNGNGRVLEEYLTQTQIRSQSVSQPTTQQLGI